MIKELNDLVWYTDKSLWREGDLLSFLSREKKEVRMIFETIRQHQFRTDEEASRGCGIGLTTFKKYGRELKEHLRNMVFFFNEEKVRTDLRSRKLIEGMKDVAAMRMLYAEGCRVASREMAEDILRKGMLYECPDFVVQASIYLKDSVLRTEGTEKEFEYYSGLYQEYKIWLDLEHQAWDYMQRVQLSARYKAGGHPTRLNVTSQYIGELEPFVGKVPSLMFHMYYFTMRNQYCMEIVDYSALLENCDRALAYIEGRKYSVERLKTTFTYMKVVAYTYLGAYEIGKETAETSLKMAGEGSINWFSAQEAYFYLSMHTGNYYKAAEIHTRVTSHRRFFILHEAQRTVWTILGAYCFLVFRMSCKVSPARLPIFRSARFMNECNVLSQDKTGLNVAIQIAGLLLLLVENKDVEAWDRISALLKYRERHLLRDKSAARSELLIRILAQLVRNRYKKHLLLRSLETMLQELRTMPMQNNQSSYEMEILPYEHLIGLVLRYMKLDTAVQYPLIGLWQQVGRVGEP
jgi:hypothetical protein